MRTTHMRTRNIQQILRSVCDHRRLRTVIRDMAREIERLDDDNVHLRAALSIYCEVERRSGGGKHALKVSPIRG